MNPTGFFFWDGIGTEMGKKRDKYVFSYRRNIRYKRFYKQNGVKYS